MQQTCFQLPWAHRWKTLDLELFRTNWLKAMQLNNVKPLCIYVTNEHLSQRVIVCWLIHIHDTYRRHTQHSRIPLVATLLVAKPLIMQLKRVHQYCSLLILMEIRGDCKPAKCNHDSKLPLIVIKFLQGDICIIAADTSRFVGS